MRQRIPKLARPSGRSVRSSELRLAVGLTGLALILSFLARIEPLRAEHERMLDDFLAANSAASSDQTFLASLGFIAK